MLTLGKNVRWFNKYTDEVDFCKRNGFDFLQVWYDVKGFGILEKDNKPLETIQKANFPAIIHALLDINEMKAMRQELLEILAYLGHKEIIIHPICRSEEIQLDTIKKLAENLEYLQEEFSPRGIKIYLENNSRLDPIFHSQEEIVYVFSQMKDLQFLIDLAHIDSYEHLEEMVAVKMPGILHVSDRHMEAIHEHLPIGEGNIDFDHIFSHSLKDFKGKIIFEITESDEKILNSKKILEKILREIKK